MGFPGGSDGKESTCNAEYLGSFTGLGRSPGGGHGNPLQYSCLENPHGQRSLAVYSPWGHEESDTTKQLSIHNLLEKKHTSHLGRTLKTSLQVLEDQFSDLGLVLYSELQ